MTFPSITKQLKTENPPRRNLLASESRGVASTTLGELLSRDHKAKKTDAIKHFQVFYRVGLLFNVPSDMMPNCTLCSLPKVERVKSYIAPRFLYYIDC